MIWKNKDRKDLRKNLQKFPKFFNLEIFNNIHGGVKINFVICAWEIAFCNFLAVRFMKKSTNYKLIVVY